jgi:hypothetical protein
MDPATWIDLDRYPIVAGAPGRAALVDDCRRTVRERALCQLPNFLASAALARFAEESRSVAPRAIRRDVMRRAYLWLKDDDYPTDDPRGWPHHDRKGTVHYDLYPAGSLMQRLYEWGPLTRFIGDVLEERDFHTCADTVMSVVLSVMKPGDEHGWHFDTNDYAISLCLQNSEGGGEFVCFPYIRDEGAENLEAVRRAFSGEAEAPINIAFAPGTLTLFRGRRSLHRVAPTTGRRDRLMAIFSYHREPGFTWPERAIRMSKNLAP